MSDIISKDEDVNKDVAIVSKTIISITDAATNRINDVLNKYGLKVKMQVLIEKK